MKTTITVRNISHSVIEYDVATQEPWEPEPETRTYHCNRSATFHGPHTGKGDSRQVNGPATTVWGETDAEVIEALKRQYRGSTVKFEN